MTVYRLTMIKPAGPQSVDLIARMHSFAEDEARHIAARHLGIETAFLIDQFGHHYPIIEHGEFVR